MKKIILLFFTLLLFGACTMEYKDIKPEPTPIGVKVQIDSVQWTPVLVKEDEHELYVYDGIIVKKVLIIDPYIYLLIFILVFALFISIIVVNDNT